MDSIRAWGDHPAAPPVASYHSWRGDPVLIRVGTVRRVSGARAMNSFHGISLTCGQSFPSPHLQSIAGSESIAPGSENNVQPIPANAAANVIHPAARDSDIDPSSNPRFGAHNNGQSHQARASNTPPPPSLGSWDRVTVLESRAARAWCGVVIARHASRSCAAAAQRRARADSTRSGRISCVPICSACGSASRGAGIRQCADTNQHQHIATRLPTEDSRRIWWAFDASSVHGRIPAG